MSKQHLLQTEQKLDNILFSDASPVEKTELIMKLGFTPEMADEIVEHHQIATRGPIYYERLDFADFDDYEDNYETGDEI